MELTKAEKDKFDMAQSIRDIVLTDTAYYADGTTVTGPTPLPAISPHGSSAITREQWLRRERLNVWIKQEAATEGS